MPRDYVDELADVFVSRLCELVAARLAQIPEPVEAPMARAEAGESELTDEEIEALADQIVAEMDAESAAGPDALPLLEIEI